MRVSIIGTGYVGIVTGACLAQAGHDVVCVDLDPEKVALLEAGRPTCHEDGLPELIARHAGGRLRATQDLAAAVQATELTMIAVGTPSHEGRIDLRHVLGAASQIGAALRTKPGRHCVVVKSTVVPGTTDGPVRAALEAASGRVAGAGFGLGMNPEFLTEGTAVADFSRPDRLVLGGIDVDTHDTLAALYAGFAGVPVIRTNNATAEMIKYASNAALATMISFANELSRLARRLPGVDIADVTRGVHASQYFTTRLDDGRTVRAPIASFLEAGCGFGGSCLPKDVTALAAQGESLGLAMPMLRGVLAVNRSQPDELFALVARHRPSLAGVPVTVLGLAFKPDTDDTRESPAFPVVERLRAMGARVTAYDPVVGPATGADRLDALAGVRFARDLAAAVAQAEVVILITRWTQFQALADVLRAAGRAPLVIDGRRVLDPGHFEWYEGIGRAAGPDLQPMPAAATEAAEAGR
jgi:UDPglucose 6-dehydrogenase